MRDRVARWLNLRPTEVRAVSLSFCGAFLALAFLVLARALREALYLTRFAVETLPYVTAGVAFLSVPTVALFARLLGSDRPRRVLAGSVVLVAVGLGVLWSLVEGSDLAVVGFYLWTALGSMVLTSGFWLVTAELFPIRGAKRVFGLVGAGGTAGAMVAGNLLAVTSGAMSVASFIPVLMLVLTAFLVVQIFLPPSGQRPGTQVDTVISVREGLRLAWTNRHLRTITLLVAVSTIASTLVDYQFKDLARASLDTGEQLAGFFGAFYGWTGAVALVLQLFVSARLLGGAGIAITLGVLPVTLLLGGGALLMAPTLVFATVARGADNSLRKSLHRAVLEILYVPVPSKVRRTTKTFIDSVADSAAEGIGALLVFILITTAGLSSRWLSIPVVLAACTLLVLAGRAQRSYANTVARQLREGAGGMPEADRHDIMNATFTELDLGSPRRESAAPTHDLAADTALVRALIDDVTPLLPDTRRRSESRPVDSPEEILRSGDSRRVIDLLEATDEWRVEWIVPLARLLARESFHRDVADALRRHEDTALGPLARLLRDPETDFAIRRRIPAVLAGYESVEADLALLDGIVAPRFEVRYRSAIGLRSRTVRGLAVAPDRTPRIWAAVRSEVSRERPVWELQRLLDDDPADDNLAVESVDSRGALSLAHTFRLLTLVLEPEATGSAYRGLMSGNEHLRSLALEYLEHVLPEDIRVRLWPFVGDLSERQHSKQARPIDHVVADLVTTNATFFATEEEREELRRLLSDE